MRRLLPLFVVVLIVAACGTTTTVTVTTTETVTTTVTQTTVPETAVRVYFLRDGKVAPVGREVPSRDEFDLFLALDQGPTQRERQLGFTTALPKSQGITPVSRAGEAQIVYTLSQFAPSKPVRGGTRADFENFTPAILVESPLPFQAVSAPLRVTGTANTFEATFEYELLDPHDKVLKHDFVTATSGSGTRGTFDFTIPFEAPNGIGKLVVYESSAADGSRIHIVEIPLTLAR